MSGNGIDMRQLGEMLHSVVQGQAVMQETIRRLFDTTERFGRQLDALSADIREQAGQIASLRQEVAFYHGTLVGHGILIDEHNSRLRSVEDRLQPGPPA